jgi:hypothetical protein
VEEYRLAGFQVCVESLDLTIVGVGVLTVGWKGSGLVIVLGRSSIENAKIIMKGGNRARD